MGNPESISYRPLMLHHLIYTDRFDGKVVFIRNKAHAPGRLTQFSTNVIATYTGDIFNDQKWRLEASPTTPGYYYIQNFARGHRITQSGTGTRDVAADNGPKHNNQLWKFEPVGDNEYRIANYVYPSYRLTNWVEGNVFGTYSGPIYNDQIWSFTEV